MAAFGFDERASLLEALGTTALVGEGGFTSLERLWHRPTLEVVGMGGACSRGRWLPSLSVREAARRFVPLCQRPAATPTFVHPLAAPRRATGGFQDTGVKTIVPRRAFAKLAARLVPDQTPSEVRRCSRERRGPPGVCACRLTARSAALLPRCLAARLRR